MIEPRSPQVVALLSCLFLALAAVPPAHGQTPVVSDSFNPTSPERQPGMPVDNAPIERGHGRWKATGGMSFADGTAVGADESEFASFRFVPVDHPRSAIVVVEADINPGSEGWAGVGFAGSELGPLPARGQLWVKLHHLGKVIVYADGARLKLYDDSQPNPAFVQGMNRVRLSYNRRLNTARAWLNGQELPLSDLSATGFAPEISSIAFHLWKIEGEGADQGGGATPKELEEPLIGGITGGIEEAFLGESFTTGVRPRTSGSQLNGVAVEFGAAESWQATPSVGFGPGYATNIGLGSVVASLPFELADAPGFATSSVEALINPSTASWVAIGFSSSATGGFESDGELWARLHETGWLQVYAGGTTHTLFDAQGVDPEKLAQGANLKLSYNRLTGSVRVWVYEDELSLTQGLGGYTPAISHAGFAAFREGGFEELEQFALDDFAVRFSDAIPSLTIAASPSSTIAVEGWRLSMSCEAAGGVAPYSYRWQSDTGEEPNPWVDLTEGVDGYYQTNQPTLIILYPDETNERYHRCVATDSNFGGSEAQSATASLQVRDAAVGDRFSNGPGQVMGDPLDGTTPDFGDGEWWAEEGTVFGIDSITNAVTNPVSDKILGKLEVPDAIAATYQSLSVQGELTIGEADWVGVGFVYPSIHGFMASGELWAMVTSSGRVKVYANAQVNELFNQVVLTPDELGEPIHLLVEHDDQENKARVWVNHEDILEVDLDGLPDPYVPPLSAVGFQASLYPGFTEPGVVRIDDFALTGDVEVPAPTMAVNPQSQQVGLGFDPQLTCGATGGVLPYSYAWERYSGINDGWDPLEEAYPYSGTASSTLTVSDFDLSLEGLYRCTVRDGRAEPASVSSASATLTTVLPNFNVDFDYGYGLFVWATLVSDGTPAGHFRVGVPYDLHFQARSGVTVAPDLDVPVKIWAQCHPPKDVDGPWSLLADTSIRFPGLEGDFTATITVPEGCVPAGQTWRFASLFIDINAESDPIQPDGYPDEIYLARSILPEGDVLWNNRWVSRNWAPVVSADIASLGQMFGEGYDAVLFKDFTSSGDLPDADRYPTDWTGAQGPYVFDEMQVSMSVDFGQNPHDVIPETFEPYVAWGTGVQAQPIAAIVRYRRVGYHVWDDELYFGWTAHPPPASPNDYPVRLGSPDGDGDSTNIVPTERYGHYRVAVWERPGGPFQDPSPAVPDDGVGFIETPEISGGSYPPTDDLHVYLGYQHACMNHDPPFGYGPCQAPPGQAWHRYLLIDYVAVWGDELVPPPGNPAVDYSAIDLVIQDLNGWITLPEVVPLDEEYRACALIDADLEDAPPPDEVWVSHQEIPGGALIDYPAEWVENLPGGEFVFCPQQGGAPVTWTPVIRGDYQHKATVDDPDDLNLENNVKTRVVSTSCPIPAVDLP